MWDRKQIGQRIRKLRTENKLTQQAVGKALDVSREHISEIERGTTSPTLEELLKLIKMLGSNAAEFFESAVPQVYQNADQSTLHSKMQDLLDSRTDFAFGIKVNILGLHDAMSRFIARKQKLLSETPDEPRSDSLSSYEPRDRSRRKIAG